MAELTLVTGGTRSGKSAWAQSLAEQLPGLLLYVATAEAGDAEMARRIARHQAERDDRWQTLEEPRRLVDRLGEGAAGKSAVLLDCLTLWLTNLLLAAEGDPAPARRELERLLALVPELPPLILVTNEVGWGVVPDNRLARDFRDLAGEANRLAAQAADRVWLVVAGLPLQLKPSSRGGASSLFSEPVR